MTETSPDALAWFRMMSTKFRFRGGCWEFRSPIDQQGYGQYKANGKMYRAHRFAYTMAVGPIPDGLSIDHLCRNRRCCNPAHLEPVTTAENNRRKALAQTHCKRDHEFNEENTYRLRGRRICRACNLLAMKKYNAKLRDAR